MNSGFVRRGDRIYRAFAIEEVRVLSGLIDGLSRTLDEDDADDPVLRRLAPAAYGAGEEEASREFAEFTRDRILSAKNERLAAFAQGLSAEGLTELDLPAAQVWLLALNDLRLALAERIGLDRLAEDEGTSSEVYEWLGWLQSGLVDAVAEE